MKVAGAGESAPDSALRVRRRDRAPGRHRHVGRGRLARSAPDRAASRLRRAASRGSRRRPTPPTSNACRPNRERRRDSGAALISTGRRPARSGYEAPEQLGRGRVVVDDEATRALARHRGEQPGADIERRTDGAVRGERGGAHLVPAALHTSRNAEPSHTALAVDSPESVINVSGAASPTTLPVMRMPTMCLVVSSTNANRHVSASSPRPRRAGSYAGRD